MSYGQYYRPSLKNSIDHQLQTAFNDGLWQTVIRLAAQRQKFKKDPYFDAIIACARSQLDSLPEKSAAVVAVDGLVRNKASVPDPSTIELYEWACRDAVPSLDYSKTIGMLRSRWAKTNPQSTSGVTECLRACLRSWDLVNAQQIAATLDKAGPGKNDGKHMFWSLTLTYLLSLSPQCPENMAAMYSRLALMQLQKAADITELSKHGRGLREEEEINLYYLVLGTQLPPADYAKKIESGKIGALQQFEQGRKHLFLEGLKTFERTGNWDSIYNFCVQALGKKDEDGTPSFSAFDWRVWKLLIKSATMLPDSEAAFTKIKEILQEFVSIKTKVAQMYRKNIGMALLELAFRLPHSMSNLSLDADKPSPRVLQLYLYIDQNLTHLATFDDVKEYVAELSFEKAKYFVENLLPTLAGTDLDELRTLSLRVLELKFRYFLTTCPQTLEHIPSVEGIQNQPFRCKFCSKGAEKSCHHCLESIATAALTSYQDLEKNKNLLERLPNLDKDPRVDFALVASMALLKLSGLGQTSTPTKLSALTNINTSRLLQAIAIVDTQLDKNRSEVGLRLVLVQLYLLIGCASLAHKTWQPMDVKRTIHDALSPLFFDRLSSISPGLFNAEKKALMEPLRSYYTSCLREEAPVKIWDAFAAGSYTSILDMAEYWDRLRRSCTLVMTLVEERRATRAFGGKLETEIDQSPLLAHVTDQTSFVNVTDYGSFPNLESSFATPLSTLVKIGPELSDERSRVALLAEEYLDIVTYKPPKDYKPAKAALAAAHDKAFTIESLTRIHDRLSTLMHQSPTTASKLTSPENKYFTTIALLSALLHTGLTAPRTESLPSTFSTATHAIKSVLASLRTDLLTSPPSLSTIPEADVFSSLTNPHTLSTLRDTALAIKHAASFIVSFNEREATRDRSGKANLHKTVLSEARALDQTAGSVLVEIKERIKMLKEALGQGGWLDRISEWTFGANEDDKLSELVRDVLGESAVEDWGGRVVESWREGIKGWGMVKMQ